MNELALFAGAGGGILGGHLLGWRTVCAVEWEAYPASVLVARQNDKILPPFPIWDDVQTFDGKPWQGIVDVVSGGFPCQDISVAGNGDGLDGERSGMWREMARIIGEVMPQYVFVENSPMLTTRGLGTVLRDLAKLGYDAEWGVLGADDVGANHHRKRIWILAYSNRYGNIRSQPTSNGIQNQAKRESRTPNSSTRQSCGTSNVFREDTMQGHETSNILANTSLSRFSPCNNKTFRSKQQVLEKQLGGSGYEYGTTRNWWKIEPNVDRVVDGMASRVDRLKAIGNGQVPLCAATAWKILKGRIDD
jgi:DNA (cytosine-5)-methyltransferase 1